MEAEVEATLAGSSMLSTKTFVYRPSMEIWSDFRLLMGPPSSFSRRLIQSSKQMMKELLNDRALSQK
jgi:hypothetical protein